MPDIRFIGLSQSDQQEVMRRICKHLATQVEDGSTVVVLTPDEALASWFDEKMWDFDDASFVPHARQGEKLPSPLNRLLIAFRDKERWHGDVYVNFGPTPLARKQWERASLVYEVFRIDTEDGQASGRARWSAYREAGISPSKDKL